jgi:hypothetical protein
MNKEANSESHLMPGNVQEAPSPEFGRTRGRPNVNQHDTTRSKWNSVGKDSVSVFPVALEPATKTKFDE